MRSSSIALTVVAVLALSACVTSGNAETIWNAADSVPLPGAFSNPNNGWTYGCVNTDSPRAFVPYVYSAWITENELVHMGLAAPKYLPDLVNNVTSGDLFLDGGTLLLAPDTVSVHPGWSDFGTAGWDSCNRFTAPAAGDYSIVARMFGASTTATDAVGYVLKNLNYALPLASGAVTGYVKDAGHTELNYLSTVSLAAGDTLDFIANNGAVIQADNVGMQLTITAVPEPSAIVLLSVGLFGLLAYAWRKRK